MFWGDLGLNNGCFNNFGFRNILHLSFNPTKTPKYSSKCRILEIFPAVHRKNPKVKCGVFTVLKRKKKEGTQSSPRITPLLY